MSNKTRQRLNRVEVGTDVGDEVAGRDLQLESALTCADIDIVVEEGRLVDEGGKRLLHPDGRTAASDIAGKREQFFDVKHLAALVAGDFGGHLEIDFEVPGHHADKEAGFVPSQDKSLEDQIDIFT